jgi:hypothetical protein
MHRCPGRVSAIAIASIVVSACGADPAADGPDSPSGAPAVQTPLAQAAAGDAANASESEAAACRFLTADEVAAALPGSFRVAAAFEGDDARGAGCTFESATYSAPAAHVRLRARRSTAGGDPFRPGGPARQQFERARTATPDARDVRGLGDAAFAAEGTLHLLRGDVYLSLDARTSNDRPATPAELRQLAEAALARLPWP